ncbi:MAG: hypothetical protein FH751_00560 [Firmicutes bacterium]|nr:hypothetical protein [Bacillota bacterium]
MSNGIFDKLKVLDIYLENEFQKILICEDKQSNNKFLVNAITDKSKIEDIDFFNLNKKANIYYQVKETEDVLYLINKYNENINIKEYINNNSIKLSRQINFANFILDKLKLFMDLPIYITYSMLRYANFIVDSKGNINLLPLIVIDNNYLNVKQKDVFYGIGDKLSIVFSGFEINNNENKEDIPPDIKSIIGKCINNNYTTYEELVKDFRTSKLYRLVNPEVEESKRVHSMRRSMKKTRRKFKFKKVAPFLIIILAILIPVLAVKAFNYLDDEDRTHVVNSKNDNLGDNSVDNNKDNKDTDEEIKDNDDKKENKKENNIEDESLNKFFNDKLKSKAEGENLAEIDDTKSFKGNKSLKVTSDKSGIKYLIAGIDLTKDEFSFLNERKGSISMWLNSDIGQKATISVTLLKGEKLLNKKIKNVYIPKNMWELYNIDIGSINGDYIKIHITPNKKGTVWIDSFDVDVLK